MFYVKHTDGECEPILRCHVCASRVVDVGKVMVVYPRTLEEGPDPIHESSVPQ